MEEKKATAPEITPEGALRNQVLVRKQQLINLELEALRCRQQARNLEARADRLDEQSTACNAVITELEGLLEFLQQQTQTKEGE